jgi:Large eukaryotic DNA virus major capsid protein/Major capsid protein N-terminus
MDKDAGGIRSLIEGRSDYELVQYGPQFTYFLDEFSARPKFQSQMLPFQFEGAPLYGNLYTQAVPHAGDLITRMYIRIHLPAAPIDNATNKPVYTYGDSVGNYMIEYAELLIDRKCIERYYGEYNELMQEVAEPETKQSILGALTSKNVVTSNATTLYIYIPFSICERGFPLCALNQGSTEIRIKFRNSTEFTFPSYQITDIIRGDFLFEYVYLSDFEARAFQMKPRQYLVEQSQLFQGTIYPGQTQVNFFMNFINPVKELFFVIKYQQPTSNLFNYDYTEGSTRHHLVNMNLKLDGYDLIPLEIGTPLYLSVIQAMDYHTRIPTRTLFYIYSLSLDPENIEPTGSTNFGRVAKQLLLMTVNPSNFTRFVNVYARSFNIFATENGIGNLLFNTTDG